MKRDFLTGLGIAEDVIDKIMAENGKDIEGAKSKYADYDSIKTQLEAANTKIEEFGKLDFDGVKKMADDYKAQLDQSKADAEKQIADLKFNHHLESALTSAKAKNNKLVGTLLDREKLSLDNEGNIKGLDEQLAKIKTENSYLFDDVQSPEPQPQFLGGTTPNAPTNDNGWNNSQGEGKLNPIFKTFN